MCKYSLRAQARRVGNHICSRYFHRVLSFDCLMPMWTKLVAEKLGREDGQEGSEKDHQFVTLFFVLLYSAFGGEFYHSFPLNFSCLLLYCFTILCVFWFSTHTCVHIMLFTQKERQKNREKEGKREETICWVILLFRLEPYLISYVLDHTQFNAQFIALLKAVGVQV